MPRRLELSGALARSQTRGRVSATRSLMRCQAGSYPLVIDLRDLGTLDADHGADEPALTIDLRRLFATEVGAASRALPVRGLGGERVELLVDPGIELVSVDLSELFDVPALLHHAPLLRCLCGVIRLDGRLHFLLDPQPVIDFVRLHPEALGQDGEAPRG